MIESDQIATFVHGVDPLGIDDRAARSNHPGVALLANCDSSVRAFSNSVDVTLWRALFTKDGAEPAVAE